MGRVREGGVERSEEDESGRKWTRCRGQAEMKNKKGERRRRESRERRRGEETNGEESSGEDSIGEESSGEE